MKLLLVYLLLVNALGFVIMLADKYRAQNKLRRTPEIALFATAVIGGSIGVWAGMYAARHKTKKWHFVLGIPLILLIQIWIMDIVLRS